jgi:hypothetical protein
VLAENLAKFDTWHRQREWTSRSRCAEARLIHTSVEDKEKMTVQEPQELVSEITRFLVGRNLDTKLEAWLNAALPPASAIHRGMFNVCEAGVGARLRCDRKASPTFDGHRADWRVYAGSAHFSTVSNGRALVLYLLPGGSIQLTKP